MALLPFHDRPRIQVFRRPAIGAGLFVALGVHIVATTFGLSIALTNHGALQDGMSSGLLVWCGIAWIAASFIGGYVAAWVADSSRYVEGLSRAGSLGMLTFILMFLPPSTLGVGVMASELPPLMNVVSSVAWFIAIGGLFSLGTTIWGAVIGSRVVAAVETKAADSYRAA